MKRENDIETIKRSAMRHGLWLELKAQLTLAEMAMNQARDNELVKEFGINISECKKHIGIAENIYAVYIGINT